MNENTTFDFFAKIQARAEDFRHACEVRWVASFETDGQRAVYLEGVLRKRGKAAYQRLRLDTWAALKALRKPAEPVQETLL